MLKNKFKIIVLFFIIIIMTLTVTIVRADDNEADNQSTEGVMEISEEHDSDTSTTQNKDYTQGDVYLSGDEVTIDYVIDGNLFVYANTVNINSQIGGDAFILANNVNISNNGYIFSNLFVLAKNVTIDGVAYDIYSCSNNININGYIYRDIRIASNNVSISGTVGRNAYLNVNTIDIPTTSDDNGNTVTSQGNIYGDLNYSSTQELTIPEGVVIGNINYNQLENSSTSIQSYILSLGRFLVTVIIIWLLCLWLTPKFLNRTEYMLSKKLPSTIGLGILTPVLFVIISVLFLLLGITSTIATLILIILFVICMISSAIFVITINNLIAKKLNIEKTIGKLGTLILLSAIIWLISLIPFVGSIISIISSLIGFGILINAILPSNKNKDFSEENLNNTSNKNKENNGKTKNTKKNKSKK